MHDEYHAHPGRQSADALLRCSVDDIATIELFITEMAAEASIALIIIYRGESAIIRRITSLKFIMS